MAKIQDIDIPYLEFAEAAAPSTPGTAITRIYVKSDGLMYSKDDAGTETLMSGGTGMSNPMSGVGDLIQGGASGAATRLASAAIGKVPTAQGSGTAIAYAYPPGYELDYVAVGTSLTITATTETTAQTVVTGNSVTFDGSAVLFHFYSPAARPDAAGANRNIQFVLYDSVAASSVGIIGFASTPAAAGVNQPTSAFYRGTPSAAAHTYSVKAFVSAGTGNVGGSSAGSGNQVHTFLRITKV